jgi:peptidoglycan/xylan/chitin deacetylase (PgdA/CDA1 family)
MWSVDTRDWAAPDDASLAALAISEPKPGTIILMHDIQKGTSRVFAQVIAGLRDRGFALVTIDALFGSTVPQGIIRHGPTP